MFWVGRWEISEDIHEKYLNRIGNLTLLADEYNKAIQKIKVFDCKREVYKRSKLIVTNSICQYEEWNENSIENRQKGLFEITKKYGKYLINIISINKSQY